MRWKRVSGQWCSCYAHHSQVKPFMYPLANVLVIKALLPLADHPAPLLKGSAAIAESMEGSKSFKPVASTCRVGNFPSRSPSSAVWAGFYTEGPRAQAHNSIMLPLLEKKRSRSLHGSKILKLTVRWRTFTEGARYIKIPKSLVPNRTF